ncbi:hypothetical protein HYC85_015867 [Camellia sinensis]|uniref:rRNA methyltransferase 1, mitochondrial n=1 Tax=Camellia sinensis TaxID=4442 RepID=A0A7J7GY47_CAMSI|nr:hypothetical protein HYC85_015867 [Camellia sinensis]
MNFSIEFHKPRKFSSEFRLKSALQTCSLIGGRGFSSLNTQKVVEDSGNRVRAEKTLPWLASHKAKESKRLEKATNPKASRSSWEESAEKFLTVEKRGGSLVENRKNNFQDRGVVEEDEGEVEVVDDPRWDRIKNRFNRFVDEKPRSERPEFRKWNKQESWGKKTWKEGTESTVPKMVGEGIYGVGPVLAALSAGRREFYALYVQEGLDLSGNNRKKKDKKGFERVLRVAEKIGLSIKEVSKHDLNMWREKRIHFGLPWTEVTDPQNLGAIIRSAYFFGASGVVLCAKNSAPLSGVVSKASAGSLELMELRSCKNMMQFLVSSAENGWRVLGGSVSSRAIPLNEVEPGAPTILVLGSEGTGYESGETSGMDRGCSGEEFRSFLAVESLNVSVAAGVLLHHLIGSNYNNDQLGDRESNLLE